MSQRVKKPGRSTVDDSQGKRRRRRPSGSDADEDGTRSGSNSGGNGSLTGMWTPRHLNDLKVSSIYNRNSAEAPAELYRKDLISAMKLPDGEPLTPEEYWLITDSWKQEWEKGVQVPVNPESLPEPEVKLITPVADRSHDFRLPKKKYVRVTHDDFFNPDYHQLVSTAARAEKVCSYDLDDVDAAWLGCSNADRALQNSTLISEFLMEQVIEELELQCWEQVQTILKSQEGLGIEYDENVICDVCRSPESEEGNEMVFCDSCNICVHQACYGITTIPSGSWLCRTCTLGIKPTCVLCPNLGGAMKATRSGHTWAHVACAIWIPEVSIGSVEKMEPITKISAIPQSRWSLVCVLCKEKTGACIQCSVKTCKTAYHVTCAFKNGLEMKPIIVDENAEDGIKLRSYCLKHSVNTKKDKSQSGSEDDAEKRKMKAMTAEERNQARAEKLQQIEAEFYKYVRLKDVSQNLAVDMDVVILIYNYWKLKRKSLNNRPLVPPRPETTQLLTQQQEQDLEQMKMFVQLRQDLERVRNLCYMVSRREKLSRSFFRLREQTFQKQLILLSEKNDLSLEERQAILHANHGPSIYDQFYSFSSSKPSLGDYDALMSLISGGGGRGAETKKDSSLLNGVIKGKKPAPSSTVNSGKQTQQAQVTNSGTSAVTTTVNSSGGGVAGERTGGGANPYKKQFVNGARRRNLLGGGDSGSSQSESESPCVSATSTPATSSAATSKKGGKANNNNNDNNSTTTMKVASKARKPLSYLFDSDSDSLETTHQTGKKGGSGGATSKGSGKLKGKGAGGKGIKSTSYLSDSDELELPIRGSTSGMVNRSAKDVPIYSDSESEGTKATEQPAITSTATPPTKKDSNKTKDKATTKKIGKGNRDEAPTVEVAQGKKATAGEKGVGVQKQGKKVKATKKGKNKAFDPTDLIVPQREAAKKATESIRSVKPKASKEQAALDTIEAVATGTAGSTPQEVSGKEKTSTKAAKVTTLSESDEDAENEETTTPSSQMKKKSKSPERRTKSAKKSTSSQPMVLPPDEEDKDGDDEGRDEFEFDIAKDGSSKNVSYVPQRQAAKKAAEHIRSGLSNIVAARLIIEDEMELARKKTKLAKGSAVSTGKDGGEEEEKEEDGEESREETSGGQAVNEKIIAAAVVEAAKKINYKEAQGAHPKGSAPGGRKVGKKEPPQAETLGKGVAGVKEARGSPRDSDWPFLDKGSQSASRRSRERTSSSSSSGSSGSSSSSSSCSSRSSSSSSRSSSAESASPEPTTSPTPPPTQFTHKKPQSAPAATAGPGRKLKTSERVPSGRRLLRAETPPREKPTAKGGRSGKSGSAGRGGDPFRSAFSPSPEPEQRERSTSPPKRPQLVDQHGLSPSSALSARDKARNNRKNSSNDQQSSRGASGSTGRTSGKTSESPEKKGARRKGEPSKVAAQTQKDRDEKTFGSNSSGVAAAAAAGQQKRPAPKTLIPVKHTSGLHLSSESESESTTTTSTIATPQAKQQTPPSARSRDNSQSRGSSSPHKATSKRKPDSGGTVGLSDSEDESGTEEKENSCLVTATNATAASSEKSGDHLHHHHHFHPTAAGVTPGNKSQKHSGATPITSSGSMVSPLTPSENKEQAPRDRLESTEPESKRARLDPSAVTTTPSPNNHVLGQGTSATSSSSSSSSSQQLKSIFSPPGTVRGEGELLDFDTELYDLARSVTEDYPHGDEGPSSGSLSFSFSTELFCREDNKEDSARATLNLVEKLRLQHARKSGGSGGTHRPSTESSSDVCDNLEETEEELKLELRSAEKQQEKQDQSSSTLEEKAAHQDQGSFEPPLKSPSDLAPPRASPDRSTAIQGDERWVPPSQGHPQVPPSHAHHHSGSSVMSPRTPSSYAPSIPGSGSPPLVTQSVAARCSNNTTTPQISPNVGDYADEKHSRLRSPTFPTAQQQHTDKSQGVVEPQISPTSSQGHLRPSHSSLPFGGGAAAIAVAAMAAAETSPHLAAAAGLPFGGASAFMHPAIANNPALASVLAAAAAADPNSALATLLHQATAQVPLPKGSPALHGPGAASFLPFMLQAQNQQPQQQSQSRQQQQGGTGPPNQGTGAQIEGKIPLVSVAASMPPLSKPPLTSPSVLLSSANNVKTVTPPILQSAVAHIIESVVNNHSATTTAAGLPKTTLSLDLMAGPSPIPPASQQSSGSTNPMSVVPLASPTVSKGEQGPHPPADFSAVLVNKTTENIIVPKTEREVRDSHAEPGATLNTAVVSTTAISPKIPPNVNTTTTTSTVTTGRGRRASTPRAIKAATLSGVNAVIEDMISPTKSKGRGDSGSGGRKTQSGNSPARGKGPSTPRRAGQGRGGKGKGKNLVGVRKDLAGTVYDIDFDEFEENSEEKIDLRALRERRKSNDAHHAASFDTKYSKLSELRTTASPKASRHSHGGRHTSGVVEKEKEHLKQHHQLRELHHGSTEANVPALAIDNASTTTTSTIHKSTTNPLAPCILQAPLPGPVDMRTYSSSSSTGDISGMDKMGFPHGKDPSSSDIASLFMSSATGAAGATTVNDLEELDKALEVLVAAPKPGPTSQQQVPPVSSNSTSSSSLSAVNDVISTTSSSSVPLKLDLNNTQQPPPPSTSGMVTGGNSNNTSSPSLLNKAPQVVDLLSGGTGVAASASGVQGADNSVASSVSGDMSRNQLKVKIKGPFLDANYSSTTNSMSGHHHHHHHLHHLHHPNTVPNLSLGSIGGVYSTPPPSYTQGGESGSSQQHWMMSSMMNNNSMAASSNSNNLRRMRKKELLRQYWTQDMNMDSSNPGSFPGSSGSGADMMAGLPPSSNQHPLSRSVITIPKAVASMSIIPTKEDYRLDNPDGNDESNDSNDLGLGTPLITLKGAIGGQEKKRRSRGIYREMAALGIIPPDANPRAERRREQRATGQGPGGDNSSNSRKRVRANKSQQLPPSRSTFIPPTLAESVDSPTGFGSKTEKSNLSGGVASGLAPAVSTVVNVVNHPTPKLKIKFGDLSSSTTGGGSGGPSGVGLSTNDSGANHLSDSDKETPNKKAKGRPPKKRGLPEAAAAAAITKASASMEELKRQSMKFREMVMQDYAMAEQEEILKLSGTRRRKKHKRKGGAASSAGAGESETDDAGSVRSKSPEVKVIDGPKPKLILRFGKSKLGAGGVGENNNNTERPASGESSGGGKKISENGLPGGSHGGGNGGGGANNLDTIMENDSGFTGSSESGSSVTESIPKDKVGKEKGNNSNSNNDRPPNNNNDNNNADVRNGGGGSGKTGAGDKVLVLELNKSSSSGPSSEEGALLPKITPVVSESVSPPASTNADKKKYVPIRLKLSRCYEGYSLKNKDGVDVVVDRENGGGGASAKQQSDSCQVR